MTLLITGGIRRLFQQEHTNKQKREKTMWKKNIGFVYSAVFCYSLSLRAKSMILLTSVEKHVFCSFLLIIVLNSNNNNNNNSRKKILSESSKSGLGSSGHALQELEYWYLYHMFDAAQESQFILIKVPLFTWNSAVSYFTHQIHRHCCYLCSLFLHKLT